MKIEDNTGTGTGLKIDSKNRAKVAAQSESENSSASKLGEAWNIHSGAITFSAAGSMLYIKNNEERDVFIENMIVALGEATVSDNPEIMTYKDVTAGDLLTDATAVSFDSNRNFGSTKELDADMYKGKSAGTVTGEQIGLYYMGASQRLVAEINKVLPRGSSFAIAVDPKLSSGTVKGYCVLTLHLKDSADD